MKAAMETPTGHRNAAARALYAYWCLTSGKDWLRPDWHKYETGADLNGVGLSARDFQEEAEAVAPFDDIEPLSSRICFHDCLCNYPSCGEPCGGTEDSRQKAAVMLVSVAMLREQTEAV